MFEDVQDKYFCPDSAHLASMTLISALQRCPRHRIFSGQYVIALVISLRRFNLFLYGDNGWQSWHICWLSNTNQVSLTSSAAWLLATTLVSYWCCDIEGISKFVSPLLWQTLSWQINIDLSSSLRWGPTAWGPAHRPAGAGLEAQGEECGQGSPSRVPRPQAVNQAVMVVPLIQERERKLSAAATDSLPNELHMFGRPFDWCSLHGPCVADLVRCMLNRDSHCTCSDFARECSDITFII